MTISKPSTWELWWWQDDYSCWVNTEAYVPCTLAGRYMYILSWLHLIFGSSFQVLFDFFFFIDCILVLSRVLRRIPATLASWQKSRVRYIIFRNRNQISIQSLDLMGGACKLYLIIRLPNEYFLSSHHHISHWIHELNIFEFALL